MRNNLNGTVVALAAALALLAGNASAQSDDEILRQGDTPSGGTSVPPPQEETEDEELDEQVFYSGMGITRAESDFSNLGEAINLDVVLGFRIPTVKWFGIEIDIGQTIIPGENSGTDPNAPSSNCSALEESLGLCTQGGTEPASRDRDEFAMQALGISAAIKTTGRFYFLGKYGYRYVTTSIDELNESRSGNGLGLGVGYRWGKGLSGVELGYKQLSEEIDSVGLTFFARLGRRY